jgi:uncharacterized protein YcfJ
MVNIDGTDRSPAACGTNRTVARFVRTEQRENTMRKILIAAAALTAISMAPTGASAQALPGAIIGAGTGAVIGGAVTGRGEGAAVGAVVGGVTGAAIGASNERRRVYYNSNERRRVYYNSAYRQCWINRFGERRCRY